MNTKIVVRVYGLVIENNYLLVSDEWIRENKFTKFPGGGLEIGEGTIECLQREFMEELGIKIEVKEHFYTTDFYQQSAFNKDHQILSIYYLVKPLQQIDAHFSDERFVFNPKQLETYKSTKQIESFRWIALDKLNEDMLDLAIDKIVVKKILNL